MANTSGRKSRRKTKRARNSGGAEERNARLTCSQCGRTFETQEEFQDHKAQCGKSIAGDAQVESDVSKIGQGRPSAPGISEREWQGTHGQRDERPA